jgi:hypothetical protein
MGREFVQRSVLCVVAGLVFLQEPAEAGERRAEAKEQKFAKANPTFGGLVIARAVFLKPAGQTPAMAGRKEEPRVSEPTARPERKTITLFRFTTRKLGEVSVQPVVGGVNGAQLSIGF